MDAASARGPATDSAGTTLSRRERCVLRDAYCVELLPPPDTKYAIRSIRRGVQGERRDRDAELLPVGPLHEVVALHRPPKRLDRAGPVVDVGLAGRNHRMGPERAVAGQILPAAVARLDNPPTPEQLDLVRTGVFDLDGIPERKLALQKVGRLVQVDGPYGDRDAARGGGVTDHGVGDSVQWVRANTEKRRRLRKMHGHIVTGRQRITQWRDRGFHRTAFAGPGG